MGVYMLTMRSLAKWSFLYLFIEAVVWCEKCPRPVLFNVFLCFNPDINLGEKLVDWPCPYILNWSCKFMLWRYWNVIDFTRCILSFSIRAWLSFSFSFLFFIRSCRGTGYTLWIRGEWKYSVLKLHGLPLIITS